MYRAKDAGRNTNMYYCQNLSEDFRLRSELEKNLQQAFDEKQFYMVYQPIYNLATNQPIGIEALVRWHHPELGDIAPIDFIPISEEIGLIQQIGEWIIRTSCEQFAQWCHQGYSDYNYSINLSPKQLQQTELVQYTQDALKEFNLDPSVITFELTEKLIMQDNLDTESMLSQIHDMGIKISIDDFGTGYSSMVRLRSLPVQTLKIDKSFISEIGVDRGDDAIVKTILALAHSMDLTVIAEGIETKEQLCFLCDNHCEYGQGFLFSEPVTGDKVVSLLNQGKSNG